MYKTASLMALTLLHEVNSHIEEGYCDDFINAVEQKDFLRNNFKHVVPPQNQVRQ